jgi:hypothetical protein
MIGSIQEKEEIVLFSSMMTIDRQAMAMIYARFIRINKKIPLLRVLTKVSLRTTPERDLFPITYPSSFRALVYFFFTFHPFPSPAAGPLS